MFSTYVSEQWMCRIRRLCILENHTLELCRLEVRGKISEETNRDINQNHRESGQIMANSYASQTYKLI